jgi:septal ring factor EnvC (AmiA/AmiB activator)
MSESRLLHKPIFWYLFVAAVIVGLFAYGVFLVGNDTLIAQLERRNQTLDSDLQRKSADERKCAAALVDKTNALSTCDTDAANLRKSVDDLQSQISTTTEELGKTHEQIEHLTALLEAKEGQIERLRDDLAKRKTATHPYGTGQGRLVVYSVCDCGDVRVWVDEAYIGRTTRQFTGTATCESPDTVAVSVSAGTHRVTATDTSGRRWNFNATVNEDGCILHSLKR